MSEKFVGLGGDGGNIRHHRDRRDSHLLAAVAVELGGVRRKYRTFRIESI